MVQVEKFYKQNDELADIISPLKEVNRRFQQVSKICSIDNTQLLYQLLYQLYYYTNYTIVPY